MDFRNQVGIDIFGSEIGLNLENRDRLHNTPTKGSQEYPEGGG